MNDLHSLRSLNPIEDNHYDCCSRLANLTSPRGVQSLPLCSTCFCFRSLRWAWESALGATSALAYSIGWNAKEFLRIAGFSRLQYIQYSLSARVVCIELIEMILVFLVTSTEDVWTSYCTFVFVPEWFVGTAYLGKRHYGTPPRMMETSEILLLSGVAASRIEWQFFWSRISCTCPTKQPSRNGHFLIARAKTFQDIL